MNAIEQISQRFQPITLAEMDSVKLMNRTDVKFLIPVSILPAILADLEPHYRILEINDTRICPYETLYYDTHDLELYAAHHAGRLNRYKIRHRNYVGSNLSFFEIKFKNNKGRTIKTRIKKSEALPQQLDEANVLFLEQSTPLTAQSLNGVLWVDYSRMTLVNKHQPERLTIDLNLTFRNDSASEYFPEMVIAELKQEQSSGSVFLEIMKKYHIREGSISKYCFGIMSLFDHVKKNRFKPHIRRVQKIISA